MTAGKKKTFREKTFTLDGKFLRDEAREAIRSYFSPFAGIYGAATGKKIVLVRDSDGTIREHRKRA
jgi:hypothetical protein